MLCSLYFSGCLHRTMVLSNVTVILKYFVTADNQQHLDYPTCTCIKSEVISCVHQSSCQSGLLIG